MGVVVLSWLVFSVLAGMFASSRGRSFFGVFLLALFLSPLIAFVYVFVVRPLPTEAELKAAREAAAHSIKCPFCAETIKAEAIVCRYCGRDLPKKEMDTRSDDEKFAAWLAAQTPPLSLARLSQDEREEQHKAYKWATRKSTAAAATDEYVGDPKRGAIILVILALGAILWVWVWVFSQ